MSSTLGREKSNRLKTLIMAITRNPKQMISQLTLATKLLTRRLRRLPLAGQCALAFSLLLCTSIYGALLYWMFGNQLTGDRFLEVDKCPACYGFSMCDAARDGNVWFTGWSKVRFLDYVNVHNTFTGMADGKSVMITKLGRNRDITQWENRLCTSVGRPIGCDVGEAAMKSLTASGTRWMASLLKGMSNMTACPTERLLEKMMDRYREKRDAIDLSSRERIQMVTTLMLSQEPILFQTFPHSDGWPFVGYVGACGRFVAYESNWSPLYQFVEEPWLVRAHLALKLLMIANKLTDNKSQYGIYWTDISYADFGVIEKSGNVVIVNGRNLMVVDRYQIKEDKKPGWDEPLYSEFDDCSESDECKMSDSESGELCNRHVTDRNVYAVCRFILSPDHARYRTRQVRGLLANVPAEDETLHSISDLVSGCARPTRPGERLDSAAQLVTALTDIVGLDPDQAS